ncbi:MAG: hypothetical protein J6C15_10070 [Bacteroidaceae bacterium]|nr:hypothetical protein [Bacteroidaceae bacterium]
MMDIKDKDTRMALVARYLEAETTVAEEALLAAYYAANEAEEDERAIAQMIRMEHAGAALLSKEGAEEFDRIVSQAKSKQPKHHIRRMAWIGGVAAAIALLLVLNVTIPREAEPSPAFTTVEIAGYVQQLMNVEDIETVTASPVKECVLVTATLADGSTKMFIMNKDPEEGSTSMLAIN